MGQKLSVPTTPKKGYISWPTVKVPEDQELFENLFSGLSVGGRSGFDVTAEDLNNLLSAGWVERAFRTGTK